jgi:hypothetical protein
MSSEFTNRELSKIISNNNDFSDTINNNPYLFNVRLLSSDDRLQPLKIGSINSLVLEESFTNFYSKGYLILNNTFDAVERLADLENDNNLKTNTTGSFTPDRGFIFKGDSRDLLLVDILPKLNESEFSEKFTDETRNNNAFKISQLFVIYNTEEIEGENPGQKFKKLYFHDWTYNMLVEKNSYFNTASFVDSENITNVSNNERSLKTGLAIKYFLNEFFNKDQDTVSFSDDFDEGSREIFFSSPARFKGIDTLAYILDRHISDENSNFDRAFLRLRRDKYEFSLISLKNIFYNSLKQNTDNNSVDIAGGSRYLETFKLGLYSNADQQYYLTPGNYTPKISLFLDKYGTINNMVCDSMPGMYSQQTICTTAVHSYSEEEKLFAIDYENNDIQNITKVYIENYVDPFKQLSRAGSAFPNFFPGQNRLQQKNIKNVFSNIEDKDQRLSDGRNKVLFNTIFLNNTISFKVPGSTHRTAGVFIGIDRDGSIIYSDFDSKMLGVYFVVEVKHIFKGNEYFNELRCVKTYSFNSLFLNTNSA